MSKPVGHGCGQRHNRLSETAPDRGYTALRDYWVKAAWLFVNARELCHFDRDGGNTTPVSAVPWHLWDLLAPPNENGIRCYVEPFRVEANFLGQLSD